MNSNTDEKQEKSRGIKKKLKKVLIIVVIILAIITVSALSFMKVSTETFEEKMSAKDFKITNIISKYKKNKDVLRAYEAMEKDDKYAINILEFTSSKTATKYFNKEKERYNNEKDKDSAINYSVQNDRERYSITTDKNRYIMLYKHDSSIVYYDIDIKYSEEVINLLDELGY